MYHAPYKIYTKYISISSFCLPKLTKFLRDKESDYFDTVKLP